MNRERYIYRVTITGSVVNFILLIFKFIAGFLGNSSAMVADAAHSLSDFASDIVLLVCVKISGKPEDEDHAYGHGKFETLAAALIGMLLLATAIGFMWNGLEQIAGFFEGRELPVPGWIALVAAFMSIVVKEALYHYTVHAGIKIESNVLKVNAWHHRSDAFSSLATVIGIGGAMLPGKYWLILDPLAACVISLFIGGMALSLMKPGLDELMEKSLPASEIRKIETIICTSPGVRSYHRVRTRRVGVNRAVEAHVRLDGSISLYEAHEIASHIEKAIKEELGQKTHVGIHMEPAHKNRHDDIA